MKKIYIAPTVELIEYKVEDVLLASGIGMLGLLATQSETEYSVLNDKPSWLE